MSHCASCADLLTRLREVERELAIVTLREQSAVIELTRSLHAVEGERDSACENLAHALDLQQYTKEQLEMERRLLAHAEQRVAGLEAAVRATEDSLSACYVCDTDRDVMEPHAQQHKPTCPVGAALTPPPPAQEEE